MGLFGNLGSGNIGNDASLEAMLKYLAADQPGAVLDAMCAGPQTVKDRYGVPAIALRWLPPGERRAAAMRRQGLDTSGDDVYPDLAFGLAGAGDERTVGIGLMDYSGSNEDDRGRAGEIHSAYIEKMKSFTRWLVDNGRRVRLFVGDTNNADEGGGAGRDIGVRLIPRDRPRA